VAVIAVFVAFVAGLDGGFEKGIGQPVEMLKLDNADRAVVATLTRIAFRKFLHALKIRKQVRISPTGTALAPP
jgi:hypothetical protein